MPQEEIMTLKAGVDWPLGIRLPSPVKGELGLAAVKASFWIVHVHPISTKLQEKLDQGWKPAEQPTAAGFKLQMHEEIKIEAVHVMGWLASGGIGLIMDFFNGFESQKKIRYEAQEYSLRLIK